MRCALINTETNLVENLIVANPETDQPLQGYIIISIEETPEVSFGFLWDGTNFTAPIQPE